MRSSLCFGLVAASILGSVALDSAWSSEANSVAQTGGSEILAGQFARQNSVRNFPLDDFPEVCRYTYTQFRSLATPQVIEGYEEFSRRRLIVGTPGRDYLVGTSAPELVVAFAGDDAILGLGGEDLVCGGRGSDRILGLDESAHVRSGPGRDVVHRRQPAAVDG